jgi:CheY-like chemotaxis protein
MPDPTESFRRVDVLEVRSVELAEGHHQGDWPCSACGELHSIDRGWLVTTFGGRGRADHIVCPACAELARARIRPRRRVLVADDDAEYRRQLVRWLEADGLFEVCAESGDGDDTLAKIDLHDPDLLLLDLRMPGRDGFEVLEELRQRTTAPEAVVLTAYPSEDAQTLARTLGAPTFYDKDTYRAGGLVLHLSQV